MACAQLEFLSTINNFGCAFTSKCKIKRFDWHWLRYSTYITSASKEDSRISKGLYHQERKWLLLVVITIKGWKWNAYVKYNRLPMVIDANRSIEVNVKDKHCMRKSQCSWMTIPILNVLLLYHDFRTWWRWRLLSRKKH